MFALFVLEFALSDVHIVFVVLEFESALSDTHDVLVLVFKFAKLSADTDSSNFV